MYKLSSHGVIRLSDGAYVPDDLQNADWQEYKSWLSAGHIALPEKTTDEVSAEVTASYEQSLDNFLDGVAKSYRYSDRTRLALRAGYPNNHQQLAIAFGTWMDHCNDQAKQLYIDVLAGIAPMPSVTDFVSGFPAFEFP